MDPQTEQGSLNGHMTGSRVGHAARSLLLAACAVASTYFLFRQAIHQRLSNLLDPYSFNGDALQHIAPLWYLWDQSKAANDYIATYYLSAILPPLFKGIYALLTLVWTPIMASKFVALSLSVLFILTVTATSIRLAGGVAGFLTLALATGGVLKNIYFSGGIQRGFGIWLSSLALYFLVSGNIIGLTITGVVAASLYPTATVLIVTSVGFILFIAPAKFRGAALSWTLSKRLVWLTGTCLACLIVTLPQLMAGTRYGERLSMAYEAEFPEWSALGRYTQGDRGVPVAFFPRAFRVVVSGLSATKIRESKEESDLGESSDSRDLELSPSDKGGLVALLTGLSALVLFWRLRGAPSNFAMRCGIFFLATVISYGFATALFPALYIPSRYIALGIIPLVPVVFPCLWCTIPQKLLRTLTPCVRSIASLAIGLSVLTWLGWADLTFRKLPSAAGYRPLFKFIRTLPPEAVVATWPRGIGNMIPLFTAHKTLLFEEGHQIFHRDVTEETRKRMRAIIALYAATDQTPVDALRRDYGVTHILLDTRHLSKNPPYFEPFHSEFLAARESRRNAPLHLDQLAKQNTVYTLGPFVIIDISKSS